MDARPKITIELTSIDKIIEIAGWLTLATLCTITILVYSTLPDTIPIHFNARGEADDYGSKLTLLLFPTIGLVLFIAMTFINKYPHSFNYPVKITAENAFKQYTIATKMIRYLKLAIVVIFTCIVYMTYSTVQGKSPGLGVWFLPFTLALVFIPLIYFMIQSFKAK